MLYWFEWNGFFSSIILFTLKYAHLLALFSTPSLARNNLAPVVYLCKCLQNASLIRTFYLFLLAEHSTATLQSSHLQVKINCQRSTIKIILKLLFCFPSVTPIFVVVFICTTTCVMRTLYIYLSLSFWYHTLSTSSPQCWSWLDVFVFFIANCTCQFFFARSLLPYMLSKSKLNQHWVLEKLIHWMRNATIQQDYANKWLRTSAHPN